MSILSLDIRPQCTSACVYLHVMTAEAVYLVKVRSVFLDVFARRVFVSFVQLARKVLRRVKSDPLSKTHDFSGIFMTHDVQNLSVRVLYKEGGQLSSSLGGACSSNDVESRKLIHVTRSVAKYSPSSEGGSLVARSFVLGVSLQAFVCDACRINSWRVANYFDTSVIRRLPSFDKPCRISSGLAQEYMLWAASVYLYHTCRDHCRPI